MKKGITFLSVMLVEIFVFSIKIKIVEKFEMKLCNDEKTSKTSALCLNPLSANPEKWSNTLKQIVGKLPTICLSVFDHFMNLALKGLTKSNFIDMRFKILLNNFDTLMYDVSKWSDTL